MRKIALIGAGVLLLVAGIVFGAFFAGPLIASANSAQNAASTPTAADQQYCQLYNQNLAKSLGVSISTLQQDRQNADKDVLAQMVKDGKITQAQANTIEQQHGKSQQNCRFARVELRQTMQYLRQHSSDVLNQVAQGLHLTSSQLTSQLQSGKSLKAIAKAQHVSASSLRTIVTNAINNTLNQGVSSGQLTKDEETTFQQYWQQHPRLLLAGIVQKKK